MKNPLLCCLVLILLGHSECARILAFLPFPGKSHHNAFTPIVRGLLSRGHHVTFYTPYTLTDPPSANYTEVLIPNVYAISGGIDLVEMGKMSPVPQAKVIFDLGYLVQEKACEMEAVKELIRSEEAQFDAIILESFFAQESFSAFQHKFGAVAIELQSLGSFYWTHALTGSHYNPAYMADFKLDFTDTMDFWERLKNAVAVYGTSAVGHLYHLPKAERLVESCFRYEGWKSRPPLKQLLADKSLIIENAHFSLNYADPTTPNFVRVAGININPSKPLPQDIQTFMDDAIDGVIYFSLGSNLKVSDIAKDNIFQAFISAFGKLKQRVLLKWENPEFPVKSRNIKISEWFPQQDVLAHKNCKLFISHGGFLSINEAVHYGVPLISIPFFGDQPKNVKHMSAHGYGIHLDISNITETSVSWAIQEIFTNPSYRKNIKVISEIFRDRPMSPIDTAVYWIEYVIRHKGAPHMRPSLAKLPWYESMLLDVAAFLTLVVLALTISFYFMIRKLIGLVCRRRKDAKIVYKKNK